MFGVNDSIPVLVPDFSVFYNGFFKNAFLAIATLLGSVHEALIVLKKAVVIANEFKFVKTIAGNKFCGRCGNAFAPVRLAQPITDFRR